MVKTTRELLKEGASFGRKEFTLSLMVFAYLFASYVLLTSETLLEYLFFLQLLFIMVENYMTVAVYCGIRDILDRQPQDIPGIFKKALPFFTRILAYKLLAAIAGLILAGICLGMVNTVKASPLPTALAFTLLTAAWVAFPMYFLLLTLMAPVIVIQDNLPLLAAVKTSILFIRSRLNQTIKLALLLAPLWGIAILAMALYNEKGILLAAALFYFAAALEILTVKIFMLFYRTDG